MNTKKPSRTLLLLKSLPKHTVVLFIMIVIGMNLLARFQIISLPFLALNAGIFISWGAFLILDIVTKHFGAKAANILTIIAIIANLTVGSIFFGLSFAFKNSDIDIFLFSQWSILLASTIAFVISSLTNNYMNVFVGKKLALDPNKKKVFMIRSYVSTFLGQVVDNFIFVFLAFYLFPYIPGAVPVHWTIWQCIGASILCALIELLSEVVISPLGYRILRHWEEKDIGREYLEVYPKNEVKA